MIQAPTGGRSLVGCRPSLRTACLLFLLVVLAFASSCSNLAKVRDESIPKLASPLASSDFDGLLAQLRSFTDVEGFRTSRATIQFLDAASAERFRNADASLVLQRPDKIRLIIQVPTVGTRVAEMVSDSKNFKVAIYYPSKYRRFLTGTNDADYSRWREKLGKKEEQESALINARPFHFTDALLPRPVRVGEAGFVYSLSEELADEPDTRQGAKREARVLKSYYVIAESEMTSGTEGRARVRRRFWFDRTNQVRLARQEIFDAQAQLVTEARYSNYIKLSPESAEMRPGVVTVLRPRDGYSAKLTFLEEGVEINPQDLPAAAFVLENKDRLPITDLDKAEP
jgi:hypothetical protein